MDQDHLYPILLFPEEEGGYSVMCPDLPGCISQGKTVEAALENIEDAKAAWLEAAREAGDKIPPPEACMLTIRRWHRALRGLK
jgi:predicted RNase H-like HicB family nuclease